MRKIITIFSVLVITLTLYNCDEETNFIEPDIELVPIYSLTDIDGSNTPTKINIYKQQNLIIEYTSEVNAVSFTSSSYSDSSTETNYQFSVVKNSDDGQMEYSVTGDKSTGDGSLTIISDGVTEVYNVLIAEVEVYN